MKAQTVPPEAHTAIPTAHPAPFNGPIVAVIPAHDEDRFIASMVLKTLRHVDTVIVVDDGSTDQTADLAEQCRATVIRQTPNQGKAAALNLGLRTARQMGAGAVILIDGDGQQDPNDIPTLLEPIREGKADVVVGSRFLGRRSDAPGWRVVGQQVLTVVTNWASGVPLTDSQSGFRALSQRALGALNFNSRGFSVESEMQFLIGQHKLTAAEVAIVVNYEEPPKRNPIRHGLQVLNGILRMVGQHRPLLFFGTPGLLIILAGLYLGFRVVEEYNAALATPNPQLALGTALIAITLCIIGVFTIFTGVILHTIRAYMTER